MLAIYIAAVVGQGDLSFLEVLPWTLLMVIAPFAAGVSAFISRPRVAQGVMAVAVVLFTLLGVATLPSIGVGFIVVALIGLGAIGEAHAKRQ